MEIVTKIAPSALALIMLGLGLGLKIDDFKRVITNPKDFTIGIICQLILLPIVAYILVLILRLPLEIAVGLIRFTTLKTKLILVIRQIRF